jgi:hypothetical protein
MLNEKNAKQFKADLKKAIHLYKRETGQPQKVFATEVLGISENYLSTMIGDNDRPITEQMVVNYGKPAGLDPAKYLDYISEDNAATNNHAVLSLTKDAAQRFPWLKLVIVAANDLDASLLKSVMSAALKELPDNGE